MIRVFGIDIQVGEKINLAVMRTKIIGDQRNFNEMFEKRVESLFEEDPQLILTDFEGDKKGFLVGEEELLGDMKYKSERKQKKKQKARLKKIESIKGINGMKGKSKNHKHFHFSKSISTSKSQNQTGNVKKIDLDKDGIPTNHPQLEELEKVLIRIDASIDEADNKLLQGTLSEEKHTEIVERLKKKQTKAEDKMNKLKEDLKVKIL
jgi:hypothetical protein